MMELKKGEISVVIYPVMIDYDTSLEDMVAAGKYDWSNRSINTVNFPLQGRGKVNVSVSLVCFGRDIQHDEVLRGLDSLGLRPGNIAEFLAIGSTYPHLQLEFPIVQVGTVWHNVDRSGHRGLYLRKGNKERGLAVIWLEHGFLSYYRFVAVAKEG